MSYFDLSKASLLALLIGAAGCAESGDPMLTPDGGSTGGATATTSSTSSTTSSGVNTTSSMSSTTSSVTTGGTSSVTGTTSTTGTSGSTTTGGSLDGGASGGGTTGSDALDAGPPPMMTEDPFAGLFGDGGLFGGQEPTMDAGFTPPPEEGTGTWKLNPDSAPECPEDPPPIPIIGGACLGIYYGCGWTNDEGTVYSCICDWVHWLCI